MRELANPILRIADIGALAEVAHGAGALLVVDSTFAGPTVQRPLVLGADYVLHSLTKVMNGHGDALGGAVLGLQQLEPGGSLFFPLAAAFCGLLLLLFAFTLGFGTTVAVRIEMPYQALVPLMNLAPRILTGESAVLVEAWP